MTFLKLLFRWSFKIASAIPTLLYFRYKIYHENKQKKGYPIKGGSIVISNHVSIMDYFTMVYVNYFKYMHCLISEAVYAHKFLGWMSNMMGNILVHRERSDLSFMVEAENALKKKHVVTIFPEGKLSHDGTINEFKPAAVYLALRTGAPIVPCYIDAKYNTIHRTRVIVGEPIDLREYCDTKNPSPEKVKELCEMLRQKVLHLKRKLELYRKMRTYDVIDFRHKFVDFATWSLSLFDWLIWPKRYIYLDGATRKDRRYIKGRGIVVSKHYSFYDPPILMVAYRGRRLRIVVAEELSLANPKLFKWLNTIVYRRVSNSMDPRCFMEIINMLRAEGLVGIYPEGHLTLDGLGEIHEGAAYFSLQTNSPVYFYCMANPWKPFRMNTVLIGKTLHPDQIYSPEEMKDKATIAKFNEVIKDELTALYEESKKYQKKSKNDKKDVIENDAE